MVIRESGVGNRLCMLIFLKSFVSYISLFSADHSICAHVTVFWNFKAIDLPPQPAGDGHRITISDGETVLQLDDIAFGDVYLCAGQSNMEMTVPAVFNAAAEIEDSINYPNLRLLSVARKTADTPQDDAPPQGGLCVG